MKLIITGGAGFIGSTVIRKAISKGFEVLNIDSLSYASCLKNLDTIKNHKNYSFRKLNIQNHLDLKSTFHEYKPDSVIHLAAETHVDRSIKKPKDFIDTNILGTFNLLQAAYSYWYEIKNSKKFKFLHVSTDEVYGSLPIDPEIKFTEKTNYSPRNPYSASKASSDHIVKAWYNTYDLPVIITNCSNNYGPYQFPEKLIPVVITNALELKSIPVYGSGKNIRDWIFVEDHANALLDIIDKGYIGKSYNIGGDCELSNLSVVKRICKILNNVHPKKNGKYEDLINYVNDRPGHDFRYSTDITKINNDIGWKPITNFDEGLKKTVLWYVKNENWWRPLKYS